MKFLRILACVVFTWSLALAQTNTPTDSSNASDIEEQIKQLRDAVAHSQKQIAEQQQEIRDLKQKLAGKQDVAAKQDVTTTQGTTAKENGLSPRFVDASLRASGTSTSAAAQPAANTQTQPQQPEAQGAKSPLSFRIGAAEFTPGGFVDFENIFRSTNTGNVTATNYWLIPFSNTVAGHLTEYRSTGQYSRFNIKTTTKFGKNDVTGYVEFDFNGNDAANVFVTSNPHTNRIRLYWLDLKRGKWEFLGGQTWGLQTPNRVGVSPNPADIFGTYGEDAQVHVGVNYTRAGEFRAAYHFNDKVVWAAAIQNPDQFVGQGETLFPFAFNAQLGPQADAANQNTVPNVMPDVHTKIAVDDKFGGGRAIHFEAGGMMTTAKIAILPTFTNATFARHTKIGGGVYAGLNVELWKGSDNRNFAFVGSGMWGDGVGRYLIGMAPQFVVRPFIDAGGGFDATPVNVHSGDGILGFEFRPHTKSQFGVYGAAMYAERNAFCDITSPSVGTCGGKPFVGFGGPNSPNAANRVVQEVTIDWQQTFWRNPQYGAVLLVTQASYVSRAPWFVPAGAPKNAHLGMGYLSLRYVLP